MGEEEAYAKKLHIGGSPCRFIFQRCAFIIKTARGMRAGVAHWVLRNGWEGWLMKECASGVIKRSVTVSHR
jgi:hypothetical protein